MSETNKRYVVSKDMMTTLFDKTVEKEYVADAVALKLLNDEIEEIENAMVTGVKGNNESAYRKGNVNMTLANLGYESVNNLNETEEGKLLDARQGKVLNDKISVVSGSVMSVSGLVENLQNDIATVEPSSISAHDYAVGDYLMYSSQLYRVTAAIAIGDTLVAETNIEATDVGNEIIINELPLSVVDGKLCITYRA